MMMKHKCGPASIAWILIIIGALNWGLTGLGGFFGSNWNVVNLIFGNWMWLEGVIYILVGIAGVMSLFHCKCAKCNSCEGCNPGSMKKEMPMQ